MSGIELAKALSEAGLAVPLVFLSAYRDFSYARQALRYGVRDYVLKPTDFAVIRSVFTKLRREIDRGRPAAPGRGARVARREAATPSSRPSSTTSSAIARAPR